MRGCLFTLLLGAIAIVLLVVVGLPKVAAGVITSAVSAAGLQSDDTTVTVSSDPPTDLLGLHADRVRIRATDATFRGLAIGALDLELTDMSIIDRTADGVDGRLTDVRVPNVGGRSVTLDAITIGGGGDAITATTDISAKQAQALVADAIERKIGIRPTSVSFDQPDTMTVDLGVRVRGTLEVTPAGDLVLRIPDSPVGAVDVTLLHGGEDLPIRLTGIVVTPSGGLRVSGDLAVGLFG
jgi:hypothetical protein